jgi:hypothetical protein
MLTHRWHTLAESRYPWEQDALLYVRERLPDQEPIRAWSNAEFLSLDGRMNEVDLIVLTVKGLFLVEIKSRTGEAPLRTRLAYSKRSPGAYVRISASTWWANESVGTPGRASRGSEGGTTAYRKAV